MTTQYLPTQVMLGSAEDLERAYLHPTEPHLRVNFVESLDGAVEIGGRSRPLGGPVDHDAFMAMRAVTDVIVVGAGTTRAESYGPVRLDEAAQDRRRARGQAALPPLAVVTARGDLDPTSRLFGPGSDVLILTTAQVVAERHDLAEVAELVACGDAYVDLGAAVGELRSRGLQRALCEGGAQLMRSLLMVGLVDELCLTFAPILAGSQYRRLAGPGPLPEVERFRLASLIVGDGMILTRYQR
ncbi:MAG: pyrimidine reductase family protein [Acidimicrobiales bacterium]|nr:pyrimidine reductase family protein [Acidimicrobiales bacterium]